MKKVRFESPPITSDDLADMQSEVTRMTNDVEAVPGSPSSIISFQDWPKRGKVHRSIANDQVLLSVLL